MTRCRMPVVALALALAHVGLAPSVSAQYRPPEPLPEPLPPADPTPTPTDEKQAQATIVQTSLVRPLGWRWYPWFVLEGGWEQNVGFTRPPGADDVFGSLTASLTGARRGSRSQFRLTMTGIGYLYREATTWNRADAFASLSAERRLSPRVNGRVFGSYAFAHTDTERAVIAPGLLLPLVRTQTASAGTGLSWRVAEDTSLNFMGSWSLAEFESDRYLDTQYGLGVLSLTHRVTRRDDVSLNGTVEITMDDISTRLTPSVYVGYGHVFGSSLRLNLGAGGTRQGTVLAGEPVFDPQTYFYGAATLSGRVRGSSLSFSYRRSLQPLIGLGVNGFVDSFVFGFTVPMGRRIDLLSSGTYSLRADPRDPEAPRRQDWDAFFGVSSRLAEQLRLVLGYRFRSREDPLGTLQNNRATISLSYGGRGR